MNTNIIFSLLLSLYATQKRDQSPQEQEYNKGFMFFLKHPANIPYLTELHAQGMIDEHGNLTKYGNILVKKLNSNTRNPKQLNFERLCKNSTPGYNFALAMTAFTRFFEQVNEGIVTQVTPELEESAAQLCDNVTQFLAVIETVEK